MSSYSAAGCQSAAGRIVRSSTPMRLHTISALELWLERAARERPDHAAVNDVTYRELDERASACAAALSERGVQPGDRVATTLSGVDFAILMHALPKLVAVLVPVNTRLTASERRELLDEARPRIVVDESPPRLTFDRSWRPNVSLDDPEAPFAVIFTSGTTGRPKPVELSYGNFEASARANAENLGVLPDDRWL